MIYLSDWSQFIRERFNVASYSLMIFLYLGAHYRINPAGEKLFAGNEVWFFITQVPLALAVFLTFLRLRLFDEIKDVDYDSIYNPGRPLPRGLLKKKDVKKAAFIALAIELALYANYGFWAFAAGLSMAAYSLLMYNEFFVGKWLRPHLTLYAVIHTFVISLISMVIFCAITGRALAQLPLGLVYFSLAGWFIFTIFELGRKTFAASEEREGVKSYSAVFGRFGAVALALSMAGAGIWLFDKSGAAFADNGQFLWFVLLLLAGLRYAVSNKSEAALMYRNATLLFIALAYGTVIFSHP